MKFLVSIVLLSIFFIGNVHGQGFDAYEELVEIGEKKVKFTMKAVPGGEFTMGSPENEPNRKPDEGPQHTTLVDSLWIGQFEVTWDLFELFLIKKEANNVNETLKNLNVDGISRPTPAFEDPSLGMGKEGFPVVNVSPYSALTFCKWLSKITGKLYRLPTEAEWEYVCRAGSDKVYHFGDDSTLLKEYAVFYENSNGQYAKVGTKKPNAFGLFDMHGNVAEWTLDLYSEDFYSKYSDVEANNPWNVPYVLHPRVFRGGSWDDDPKDLRCAARMKSGFNLQRGDPQIPKSFWWYTNAEFIGFRLVRSHIKLTESEINSFWEKTLDE